MNGIHGSFARALASCSVVVIIGSCGTEQPVPSSSHASAGAASDRVQWLFTPTAQERTTLDSLLRVVRYRYSPSGQPLSGQLDTLAADGGIERRYLLVTSMETQSGGTDVVKLFVLTREVVSAPSPMSIVDQPNRFAVTSMTDLDRDGLADVAFCTWEGRPGMEGTPRAIGYRDGRWYEIRRARIPWCGPLPERSK